MIEKPQRDEEVLIEAAEGHDLPSVLSGLELPVKGVIVEEASGFGSEFEGQLWWVQLSPPLPAKVQVHRDQLRAPGRRAPKEPAAQWTTHAMLNALLHHTVGKNGGVFGVSAKEEGDWSVMAEYGSEAADSPMAGAAVYGMGGSLRAALMPAGDDAGLWEADDSEEPAQRQKRILLVEGRVAQETDGPGIITREGYDFGVETGSSTWGLISDADEVFVFRGDQAYAMKHRDVSVDPEEGTIAVALVADLSKGALVPMLKQERKSTFKEIESLTPHEVKCRCVVGGSIFDWQQHHGDCPRHEVGAMLKGMAK
jgi:hypothetical protein